MSNQIQMSEWLSELEITLAKRADDVPKGWISVYELKDALAAHGGGGERLIRELVLNGELERTTFRQFGIDGRLKHMAFYRPVRLPARMRSSHGREARAALAQATKSR